MAITLKDIAWESLRPLRQVLIPPRPGQAGTRFAEMVRVADARGSDGIGIPIPDLTAAVGRRIDFQI